MPVRKFRRVEDIPAPWHTIGDPSLYRAIESVWDFGQRIGAPRFPPGVYRHRSVEEMNSLDEEWAKLNFDRFWERRAEAAAKPGA
jgi:hypothetical protein